MTPETIATIIFGVLSTLVLPIVGYTWSRMMKMSRWQESVDKDIKQLQEDVKRRREKDNEILDEVTSINRSLNNGLKVRVAEIATKLENIEQTQQAPLFQRDVAIELMKKLSEV